MSFLANLFGNSLVGQTAYDWGTGNPSSQSLTNISNTTEGWKNQARTQGYSERHIQAGDRGLGGDIDALNT